MNQFEVVVTIAGKPVARHTHEANSIEEAHDLAKAWVRRDNSDQAQLWRESLNDVGFEIDGEEESLLVPSMVSRLAP